MTMMMMRGSCVCVWVGEGDWDGRKERQGRGGERGEKQKKGRETRVVRAAFHNQHNTLTTTTTTHLYKTNTKTHNHKKTKKTSDYAAMCRDYYVLQFMDPSVDTSPIAPALQAFFDDVLGASVTQLNFKAIVDGLGDVLFAYPFRVPAYYGAL